MDSSQANHRGGRIVVVLAILLAFGALVGSSPALAQEEDATVVASVGEACNNGVVEESGGESESPAPQGPVEGSTGGSSNDTGSQTVVGDEQIVSGPTDAGQTSEGAGQTGGSSEQEVSGPVESGEDGDSANSGDEAQGESQEAVDEGANQQEIPTDSNVSGLSENEGEVQSAASGASQSVAAQAANSGSGAQEGQQGASAVAANQQKIADGRYELSSALSKVKVLTVANNSAKSGAKVNIATSTGVTGQIWVIRYASNGLYRIFRRGTNLVLAVLNGKAVNNSTVGLTELNKSKKSQLWSFERVNGKYYSIASALNPDYVLDVKDGKTNDGTNVRLYKKNSGEAQQFKLYDANPAEASTVSVTNGTYVLATTGNMSYRVAIRSNSSDSGANVQLAKKTGRIGQKFHIDYDGNGYYVISNVGSTKVLSVKNPSVIPANNVIQAKYNGSDIQKWAIHKTSTGYVFVNKATGLALEVSEGKYTAGKNVHANVRTNRTPQSYKLKRVYLLNDGISMITSAMDDSKVVEISGGSNKDGARAQLNEKLDELCQRFEIQQIALAGQELYRIRTAASGGFLTIKDGKVIQYGSSKTKQTDSNTWSLVWNGTFYSMRNVETGKVLALNSGKTSNGTVIVLAGANGSSSQHFVFTGANLIGNGTYVINTSAGRALDISGSTTKDGANVRTYKKTYKQGELFAIQGTSGTSNEYVITNKTSGKAVSVVGGNKANFANVDQETNKKKASQIWEARIADGGYILFVNKNSGKALSFKTEESSAAANVRQTTVSNATNQKWKLQRITWNKMGKKLYFYDTNGKRDAWTMVTYNAWNRIKSMTSKTSYIAAVDKAKKYTNIFEKQGNLWKPLHCWRCSIGPEGTAFETPTGTWETNGVKKALANTSDNDPTIVSWDVRWWTVFYPRVRDANGNIKKYGAGTSFHSLPYYPGTNTVIRGVGLGQENTGSCVRLATENAKWIYDHFAKGTKVHVYR